MAATKRNAGLTSAVHRATLNDEELVSQTVQLFTRNILFMCIQINEIIIKIP